MNGIKNDTNQIEQLTEFKYEIEKELKKYAIKELSRNQLIYLDSLLHDLDLIYYFVCELDTTKNDFYFKAFEIPRAIISCVIEENNNIRLLESKNERLCGCVEERINIEKKHSGEIKFLITYEIEKCSDLFDIYRKLIIDKKICIKKCKNCKKFFITKNRTDEVYCSNPSPQNINKTCKEYGAKKMYRDEIKSTPIKYEHNRTSQFYRMRIKRSKNEKEKTQYEKAFNTYKEDYQKKKNKYKTGKLKESDFVEWIKNQKIVSKE